MAETIRKNVDLNILDYYDTKIKDYVDDKVGTGGLTIDTALSDTSTNPVQNKVIKAAIDEKANSSHTHVKADVLDSPESLPANGGNADTVNGHTVEKDVPSDAVFTDTVYSLPKAGLNTLGGVKTTSSVTSSSGYTPCPIISGVPYYKDTNTTYTLSSLGVTMSTSSASGGSNGDIHFQYS